MSSDASYPYPLPPQADLDDVQATALGVAAILSALIEAAQTGASSRVIAGLMEYRAWCEFEYQPLAQTYPRVIRELTEARSVAVALPWQGPAAGLAQLLPTAAENILELAEGVCNIGLTWQCYCAIREECKPTADPFSNRCGLARIVQWALDSDDPQQQTLADKFRQAVSSLDVRGACEWLSQCVTNFEYDVFARELESEIAQARKARRLLEAVRQASQQKEPQTDGDGDRPAAEVRTDGTLTDRHIHLRGKQFNFTPKLREVLSYLLLNPNSHEEDVIRRCAFTDTGHLHKTLKDLRKRIGTELKRECFTLTIKTEERKISCTFRQK